MPEHSQDNYEINITNKEELKAGPLYTLNEKKSMVLKEYIEKNIKRGYIQPLKSPIAQPIIFVLKKTGELRLYIDYKRLNKVIVKDKYRLLLIYDLKDRLRDVKYFTHLDLRLHST